MKLNDLIRFTICNAFIEGFNPNNCGMANAYIAIPTSNEKLNQFIKDLDNDENSYYPFDNCNVHGGITFYSVENISNIAAVYSKILTEEEQSAKYHIVGWDTRHLHDNSKKWDYANIIQENEKLANAILETLNRAGF